MPVIPFVEAAGKTGGSVYWQSGPIGINSGTIPSVIMTPIVTGRAHCPVSGVKVQASIPGMEVLMTGGSQYPVMPLFEVVGSIGGCEFWHNGPMGSNSGNISLVTMIRMVVSMAHCPSSGVKV